MASWKKDSSGNWKKSESSKKNYTIVNGQKVEKTTATASAPSTSSDTWNKDTVTLEEAAQQTKDVESGVINVDTGSTSLETPATTEKISLEQAATQTQTESANRVLASEAAQNPIEPVTQNTTTTTSYDPTTDNYSVTKVTDTETTYNNLGTIKAGSDIKSAAQLDPITVTETESKTETYNIGSLRSKTYLTPLSQELNSNRITADDFQEEEKETTSSKVVNSLESIYNSVKGSTLVSSVGNALDSVAESKLVQTELKIASAVSGVDISDVNLPSVSQVASSALYGLSGGEKGSISISDKEYITASIAKKGQSLSEYIESKGSALIDKGLDVLSGGDGKLTVLAPSGSLTTISTDTVGSVAKGAILDTTSFLVTGTSAIPLVAEVAVRDPEVLPSALISGGALLVGSTAKTALDDPARLAGQIIGGAALSKGAGNISNKVTEANAKYTIQKTMKQKVKVPNASELTPIKIVEPVSNPVIKASTSIPKVGKIRNLKREQIATGKIKSSESFQAKNIIESQVSPKRALNRDSFDIRQQTNLNQVAKVESPEAAPNYYKNLAELRKLQKDGEVIGYDTKPGVRPQPDITDVPKNTELVIDKYAKKREWTKDNGDINRKTVSKEKITENELADAFVKNEYFYKKNMKEMLESETGELRLDVLIKQEYRVAPEKTIAERARTKQNLKKRKSSIKEEANSISSIPAIGIKSKQASSQSIGQGITQVPIQSIKQDVLQIQKQSTFQKQTPKQSQKQTVIPVQKLKQSVAQAAEQKQTTPRQQEPIIKDPVKPPREPIKTPSGVPRMPRLKVIPPAEITPRKARHSKKKGKKSKVEIDTIKNTYIDPMKALGRRKL